MAVSTVQISTFSNPKTQPNADNPLSLIPKCTSLRELKQIQAFAFKTHLRNDPSIIAKLISYCASNPTRDSMDHAHRLFDQIPQPDIIPFNTIAKGYARSDTPLRAVEIYARTVCPGGTHPDRYTFPSLLKACAAASMAAQEGRQLHCQVIKRGLGLDPYVGPALVNVYCTCGDVDAARRVFDATIGGSDGLCVVAYNAIISSYARNGRPNEALALFRALQESDAAAPTDVTMLGVLLCCALLGALELGRWAHEYIKKRSLRENVKVSTALVDMYAKCGSLEEAEAVFAAMPRKDTPAWSAMILAYATHGRAWDAFMLFDEMQRQRFKPDDVTFLGLLYACNHAGLVQQGRKLFASMSEDYGVVPKIKHYGCLVDLLGRSGQLEEAFNFIDKLLIRPTPIILWRTLLSSCCSHGNFELGKRVVVRIFALDDSHGGDYVIFSNLCAKSGKWEELDSLRKKMMDKRVAKIPGCSSIEVNNVVHEFFSGGDRGASAELYRALDELVAELKRVGYKPDVSLVCHDMGDEEKEVTLRYHSEKLAIAYGLLNTAAGKTIRVVKNLRVCGDCHSMAKFVSLVSGRLIVLRDVHRFHHFKDGKCSCGDYW